MAPDISQPAPVSSLLARIGVELSQAFDSTKFIRVSLAPGSLDVMGGIAECTGSIVCRSASDSGAAVAIQDRADREIQVFSFNQFDAHQPFTLRIPVDSLARSTTQQLRNEFAEPGRRWAGHVVGCLAVLNKWKLIDLNEVAFRGLNIALVSNVPRNAGMGESAAVQVATMKNLVEHFNILDRVDDVRTAEMCTEVAESIIGEREPAGAHAASCLDPAEAVLVRVDSRTHQILAPLVLPKGFCIAVIDSGVRSASTERYDQMRAASEKGHAVILETMRQMGRAAGRELIHDPMNGFLANVDRDDYKKFFRPYLPADVLGAVDHHVLEARRIRQFCDFIEQAAALPVESRERYTLMDKAGHLMYASHLSCTNDAQLGCDECDRIVELVRKNEKAGLYGARMAGWGQVGYVVVLSETSEKAHEAINAIRASHSLRL